MRTIKWGIIGAGNISSTFATALKQMEYTDLAAVASRSMNKAQEFAGKFSIAKAYGSYEELVKDPDIDVIYIGTPHTEHMPNAELCIKNGKSVLCEKPFTLNGKETKYLMDLAKEHNVFLMEAMWTKFLPVTKKVKEWLADGKIGKVKKMQVGFGFTVPYDESSRLYNYALAGGALLDAGVYPITYAVHLMDKLPVQVSSAGVFLKDGIDEQNCVLFKFDNDVLAMISSGINAEVGQDAIIIGDKGRIIVPNFWRADAATIFDRDGKEIETYIEEGRINGYDFQAYEVNECLRNGKLESSINPLQDTLDVMTIMDGIRAEWGLKYQQEID
ncbi:MAG: Gfo/Idh/MocA family oxidoreductase [Anaerocolumna sp.]